MSDLKKPLALQAKNIRKSFNGVAALKGVSLNLYAGEVHGLNGENGAGKSTLIKIITGFYQSDAGELLLEGSPATFAKPLDAQRSGISTVYQEINLIPERTVAENILLGREPRRAGFLDKKAAVQQVQAILERYGLDIDPRAKVSSLGLGMQQMVAIVRSVAFEAKVVILDEPTSALNGKEIETLFGVIRQLRSEGAAVLFVSHRMSELYELCDRFTVLRDGEFITESTPAELPRVELVKAMLGGVELGEADTDLGAAKRRVERLATEEIGLSVRDLCWSTRVRNVSFDVRKGEIVGLLGLLGAGRTETCKALFGAVKAESGDVLVDGKALTRATPSRALRAGLAYLSEDRRTEGIFAGLSIKENLTAATLDSLATFGFVSLKAQNKVVKHYSTELKIKAANPEQSISELSGGNQQKVLLARWLSREPKAILLDDPTRGIDIGAKAEVHRVVRALADKGISVVMTSSETEELLAVCDRLIVLSEGRVMGEVYSHEVDYQDVMRLLSGQAGNTHENVGETR
ncbi:sugar ABC transporter ATP-binding protein [Paenarthrobacter sp. OM7]|uniref:Sugar ABC transporter ATP-binding protein n=1 Tax=Paenarthrobacter sp. AMU7 TaxID=3162492 RepID=A0AB39YNQ9_9MICC|nr:sugar ABC transporter ATP-binding protein [Paenarthrobacter sp. OM7]WGM20503.1 sugar ABC transporter ATP-binding protein [Paenarthrobacter sp. OM7]